MELMEEVKCFHCGEDCEDSNHQIEDKQFCCLGCKTVYQLLEENDLCEYYDLEKTPGNTLQNFFANKYNFLDNEEIISKLLDFESKDFHKVTLDIPSIHCSSCIWLLENLQRFDEGIVQSRIQFSAKKLSLDYKPTQTSLKAIVELLCQLGYEPEITLDTRKDSQKKTWNTSLLIKLGIAGFAFGNIMLFSFPEYLGITLSSEFVRYFGYLNLALSLPVLLYCAQDFFISAFRGLKKRILNIDLPIAIGILVLFVRSSYEVLSQTGAGYFDSMAALVFLLLIGRWFQDKTYRELSFDRNYKSYFPLAVYQIKNGIKKSVLVEELVAGDRIEVRNEEIIPCDAILTSPEAQIDYSFVTGESKAIEVKEGEKIYAGGRVKGHTVTLNILQEVSNSYLTQLWNNEVFAKPKSDNYNQMINRVSTYFTPVIIGVALITAMIWLVVDSSKAWNVFSSVLIIACPCALALATPFTLGSLLNVLSSKKFYIKNTETLEKIWETKHIVFDKTGTITYHHKSPVSFQGEDLSEDQAAAISALCQQSTHPLSQSIVEFLTPSNTKIKSFEEIKGQGLMGETNYHKITLGSNVLLGKPTHKETTGSKVHVQIDDLYLGYFLIKGSYRKGLQDAIARLKQRYQFSILSGDNNSEQEKLQEFFPAGTQMHFDQSPVDKLERIKAIEAQSPSIMIGDGLNDAGALQASSVGVSISDNLSSFTPASDAILLGKKLVQLPEYLSLIFRSKQIIIAAFIISFLYNVIGLSFAVMGWVTPVFAALLMPISSISVVSFVTLAVRWSARKLS